MHHKHLQLPVWIVWVLIVMVTTMSCHDWVRF